MTHVAHFLAEPLTDVPVRRPGSFRRTSSVDMVTTPAGLELIGRARDADGSAATCHALVAANRTLATLTLDPTLPDLDTLIGRLVGKGFRAAVDTIAIPGTLESVLLCELPVAALLSGYGSLYTGQFPSPISDEFLAGLPVNVCAGWAEPGSVMIRIRQNRSIPTPDGPTSPVLDADAWHAMPDLDPGSMRRQRLIQRDGDEVWAMFRDTYARPDGRVIVLHEYSVAATLAPIEANGDRAGPLSRRRSRVLSCVATPRVLPWVECPTAAASAATIEGQPVADLRALVKDELVGTSTCTHLNDLLASLSQADVLT